MIKTMVAAIRVGVVDGCLKSGGDGGIDGIRGGGNCGSSGLRCPRSDDGGGNKNGRREAYIVKEVGAKVVRIMEIRRANGRR